MAMYKTDVGYLVSGIVILLYVAYALITGEVLRGDIGFASRQEDPIDFYVNSIGLALIGAALLYRSLLFIPGNREYHAQPDRTQDGPQEADPGRIAKATVLGAAVLAVFLILFGQLFM